MRKAGPDFSTYARSQLMQRLEFDLPFRWFVGLGVDDPVLGSFGFLEEPRPALSGGVALKFLNAILKQPRVKRLLSTDHFSIDGWLKPGLR